jgi:hypothetical protein
MEKSIKEILEINLSNAYTYSNQNLENFGFSVLIFRLCRYFIMTYY